MPRKLKLLPLVLSLATPPCAYAAARPVRQPPPATRQAPQNQKELAEATRHGDGLLELYVRESARAEEQYPMPRDANEETRRPVFEKREAALAPLKARMRAAADQLETLAGSQPGGGARREAMELATTLRVYGSGPGDPPLQVFRQAQVKRKAIITSKPEPGYTEEARRNHVTGIVRLRAVLAADGRIKHIIVIRWLPDGLTEKAVEAARRIKFNPALVDGQPVSQFVTLEYNFNL
ncbi:MAG TPA: energy transducer TonB [Pyrinomonadaceae bacterium]|nr:energy transducer TonB [Pyrinomonadaceae bacterium]